MLGCRGRAAAGSGATRERRDECGVASSGAAGWLQAYMYSARITHLGSLSYGAYSCIRLEREYRIGNRIVAESCGAVQIWCIRSPTMGFSPSMRLGTGSSTW